MSETERTEAVGVDPPVEDDAEAAGAPDPEMDAAMFEALAPVVARAGNGGPAAEPAAPREAMMTIERTAIEVAAPAPGGVSAGVPLRDRVYDHLVEGEDDVVGLIAYSLYEQDRREWLGAWEREHGREPRPDQLEAFVNGQLTFAQRDRYRTAARQVLDAYASVAVDLEKPLIIRDGIAGRVEEAAKKVESSARWWRQLPAILAGAVIAAAIVIAVVAILVAAGVDIAAYLGFEAG